MSSDSGGWGTDVVVADERGPEGAAIEYFIHCCLTGQVPITSGREERKPQAVVLVGYESMRAGRPTTVP